MAQKQYLTVQEFLQKTLLLIVQGILLSIFFGITLSSLSSQQSYSRQKESADIPSDTDKARVYNSRGDCYQRVAQELAETHAGEIVTTSRMNYYYAEIIDRCRGN